MQLIWRLGEHPYGSRSKVAASYTQVCGLKPCLLLLLLLPLLPPLLLPLPLLLLVHPLLLPPPLLLLPPPLLLPSSSSPSPSPPSCSSPPHSSSSSMALQLWKSLGLLDNSLPYGAALYLSCPLHKLHLLQKTGHRFIFSPFRQLSRQYL